MKRAFLALCCCILWATGANAQQPAALWLDASQFGKANICLDIQAAIAALPANSFFVGGAVIDARNFAPPSGTASIPCTVNPFTVSSNALVLVNNGTGTTGASACGTAGAGPSAGCLGGVVLLPGYTIATDVPWLVPGNWSIIGEGSKVTVLSPSSAFNSSYFTGTVATTSGSVAVTLSGTGASWNGSMVGTPPVRLFSIPRGTCTERRWADRGPELTTAPSSKFRNRWLCGRNHRS